MAVLYLEDYIEAIDTLPQDMKSNFSHLRTMELQVQSAYMWGVGWRVLWLYTLVWIGLPFCITPSTPPSFFSPSPFPALVPAPVDINRTTLTNFPLYCFWPTCRYLGPDQATQEEALLQWPRGQQ